MGAPLVFDVDGFGFGCAACIEINFPELFAEYDRLGDIYRTRHVDDPRSDDHTCV